MKKLNYLLPFLFFTLSLCSCTNYTKLNKHIVLDNWKYKIDDSTNFANQDYNDSSWQTFSIDTTIDRQGYDYNDQYCWYRVKVYLPSSLVSDALIKDSIKFNLGLIGTFDQFFLNGYLVGENNKTLTINTPVNDTFASITPIKNIEKIYFLNKSDKRILWNSLNTIAVRVYNRKFKRGAAYISAKGIEDRILYNKKAFYLPDNKTNEVDTSLVISNISKNDILKGKLNINAINSVSKKEIFNKEFDVNILPGNFITIPVGLPVTTDFTKIYLSYLDLSSNQVSLDSLIIPFVLTR